MGRGNGLYMFHNIQHVVFQSNFLLFACTAQYMVMSLSNLARMDVSGSGFEQYVLMVQILFFTALYLILIFFSCVSDEVSHDKSAKTDSGNKTSAAMEFLSEALVFARVFVLANLFTVLNAIISCVSTSGDESFVCLATWPMQWRIVFGFFYMVMSVSMIGSIFSIRSQIPDKSIRSSSSISLRIFIIVATAVMIRSVYLDKYEGTCLVAYSEESSAQLAWGLQGNAILAGGLLAAVSIECLCLVLFLGFSDVFDAYQTINHEPISLHNHNFLFRSVQLVTHGGAYVAILLVVSPLSTKNGEVILFVLALVAVLLEVIEFLLKWVLLFSDDGKTDSQIKEAFFQVGGQYYKAFKAL